MTWERERERERERTFKRWVKRQMGKFYKYLAKMNKPSQPLTVVMETNYSYISLKSTHARISSISLSYSKLKRNKWKINDQNDFGVNTADALEVHNKSKLNLEFLIFISLIICTCMSHSIMCSTIWPPKMLTNIFIVYTNYF